MESCIIATVHMDKVRGRYRTLSKKFESILLIIWTQSLVATIGSLYFSEILGYIPCELCWIQRILMYPIVVISSVAIYKKNVAILIPSMILSGIGMFVSAYHYGLQKLSFLQDAGGFCGAVPCNLQYINYFGFITIPFLAGVAFIVIFVSHMILFKRAK